MGERTDRRGSGARSDPEGQREHANRRECQHPADDKEDGARDRVEKGGDGFALHGGEPRERHREHRGEEDERQ